MIFGRVANEIGESVANGRALYDGAAYGACLDQADAAGCSETATFDTCANSVTTPLVSSGGACQQQAECIDSACVGGDSSANADGVCTSPLAVGAACEAGTECSTGSCPFGTCEPKAPNGSACFDDDECVSDFCDSSAFVCAAETPSVCD
jgi:hypothetical protein